MYFSSERVSDEFLSVNSCDRQFLSDRDYITSRRNGRADYHILYIEQGRCTIGGGENAQTAEAGSIVLFKPYEPQLYSFYAADKSVSCYIHFSGRDCERLLDKTGLSQNRISVVGLSHTLDKIFTQLTDEFILKKPFYEEICASLLMRFLAAAGRKLNYTENNIKTSAVYSNIDNICKIMHTEYYKNLSITEYAKMCSLSYDRFSHAFRERTGYSPKNYLLRIKIDKACEILSRTDLNISEAAEAVGINDANYFSRIIKKYTGHPPKYFKSL